MNIGVKDIKITYNGIYIITEHVPGNTLGKGYRCSFSNNLYTGEINLVCIETSFAEDKFEIDTFNSRCHENKLLEVKKEFKEFSPEEIRKLMNESTIWLKP